MSRTVSVTLRYVDVDVNLEDIDTEDLIAELAARRRNEIGIPSLSGEEKHPVHAIYYAFKFGLDEKAAELARAYVCDELGVVL